jgi:hypothetical protein
MKSYIARKCVQYCWPFAVVIPWKANERNTSCLIVFSNSSGLHETTASHTPRPSESIHAAYLSPGRRNLSPMRRSRSRLRLITPRHIPGPVKFGSNIIIGSSLHQRIFEAGPGFTRWRRLSTVSGGSRWLFSAPMAAQSRMQRCRPGPRNNSTMHGGRTKSGKCLLHFLH